MNTHAKIIFAIFSLLISPINYAQNPTVDMEKAAKLFGTPQYSVTCAAIAAKIALSNKNNELDNLKLGENFDEKIRQANEVMGQALIVGRDLIVAESKTINESEFKGLIRSAVNDLNAKSAKEIILAYMQCYDKVEKSGFVFKSLPATSPDVYAKAVIEGYKKSTLNWRIEQLSLCGYKMLSKSNFPGATQSMVILRQYFFSNLQKADVVKTITLGTDVGYKNIADIHPYAVVLTSKGGQQLYIQESWFEPNIYNVPPRNAPVYKDELYFKTEVEAKQFQSAASSLAKSCN